MMTMLMGRTGEVVGRDFVIPADVSVVRIGASPDNEICIRADGVSRAHARILRRPDGYWAEDAGSRNGTFINGLPLKSERLRHLDVLTLARHVDLVFVESKRDEPVRTPPPISVWLEFEKEPRPSETVDIPEGELTIGRGAACQVLIRNSAIGKAHARVIRRGSQVTIEDLQSPNGTFVNDQRITVAVLKNDDRVSIAGVSHARFVAVSEFGPRGDSRPRSAGRLEPVHDQDWRTRVVWSPTERDEIERSEGRILELMAASAPPPPMPAVDRPAPPPLTSHPTIPSQPPTVISPSPAPVVGLKRVELTGGPDGPVILGPGLHTIGRRGAADVRLAEGDRQASRIHAQLTVSESGVLVDDRSANGTFVNGERLAGPLRLGDHDALKCGGTTFIVRLIR